MLVSAEEGKENESPHEVLGKRITESSRKEGSDITSLSPE